MKTPLGTLLQSYPNSRLHQNLPFKNLWLYLIYCFWETSSAQLPNSPPAEQLPPLLPESPIITESRVPLILENSVTGEDTNSLLAEPPKQQLRVYSRRQPS